MSSEAACAEIADIKTRKEAFLGKSFFYTRRIFAVFGFRRAVYFFLQAFLHRDIFAKWFDFIEIDLPAGMDDSFKLKLVMRPAFRFVSRQFGVLGRIEALTSYYMLLRNRFSQSGLSTFIAGCDIAEIAGKSGKKYIIRAMQNISKEGIITIRFFDDNAVLAILTGIIALDQNQSPIFRVGMLRGPGPTLKDGKHRIVETTRDLNGLRPKQAVVHATAAMLAWFQAGEIVAPTSRNEIAIKNWFKGHKIKANHDSFWEEFSKEIAPDGNYHLPLPLPRRDMAEVQQKRRKDWLQRYKIIDAVSANIRSSLDKLAGSPS